MEAAKTNLKEKKSGIRIPLKFQIAGLLAFFVAVLGLISIYSTIDYLEQNKTSQVREIQNLQVTRQISDLNQRWDSMKTRLTDQAFRLLDPTRGAVNLPEDWDWIRVGDKISQNPQFTDKVATYPGPPAKREFLVRPSDSQKSFFVFVPLDIKQGSVEKQEWAMAEVSRTAVLGKQTTGKSAIQEVLINMAEFKGGFSQSDLERSTWQGNDESVKAFGQLVTLLPVDDRKALFEYSPQTVSREITLQNKAGYIMSWASLPIRNSDLQLTLVTFVDRESLLRSFRSFVVKQGFFAFLILGAGFMFAIVISRRLSKPVEQMARAAKILETGDFNVRVDINRADEIGDLAKAFNHMGAALQEREDALKQAQNAIVQNEKLAAIGTLSAGIAHEVKNPLAGILGNADLVANQIRKLNIPSAGPLLNYIEVIQKETKRCRGIIDSLMRFSRQEKATYAPMDLEVVLWETIQLVEHSLNLNRVTIAKDFSTDVRLIEGNANQIEQTLLNMIQNAGHAMPDGGKITLATRYFENPETAPKGKFTALQSEQFKGAFCRISIQDSGVGMTEEVLKKIFEPFFTTKPKGVGTGLGLAVTLGILADHKARITIDSATGKGTTFFMDFNAKSVRTAHIVHELEEIKKKAAGGASISTDVTFAPKKDTTAAAIVEIKKVIPVVEELKPFPETEAPSERSQSKSLRPPPPKKKEDSSLTESVIPVQGHELDKENFSALSSVSESLSASLKINPSEEIKAPEVALHSSPQFQKESQTETVTLAATAPMKKFQIKKPQVKPGAPK